MNKTEVVAAVAEKTGMTKKDAERVMNAALETITESLVKGESVQLSGFGVFDVKHRNARIGRNPRTKEPVEIPATNIPGFRPCKALKEQIS